MVFEELNETKEPVKIEGIYDVEPPKKKRKQKKELAHEHPAEIGANVKVEKRPEYIGSLGEVSDEGCDEHANLRFVLTENIIEEVSHDANKLAEYMVFSEILGPPKCKR